MIDAFSVVSFDASKANRDSNTGSEPTSGLLVGVVVGWMTTSNGVTTSWQVEIDCGNLRCGGTPLAFDPCDVPTAALRFIVQTEDLTEIDTPATFH